MLRLGSCRAIYSHDTIEVCFAFRSRPEHHSAIQPSRELRFRLCDFIFPRCTERFWMCLKPFKSYVAKGSRIGAG